VHPEEQKRRQMEAEMNRFEAEISGGYQPPRHESAPSSYGAPPQRHPTAHGAGPSFQFIPHSLQRQLPQRPSNDEISHHTPPQLVPMQPGQFHPQGTPGAGPTGSVGYTVTPMGLPPVASQQTAVPSTSKKAKLTHEAGSSKKKNKKNARVAGGQVWEDQSLQEWDSNDFRIFCGDLGNDVTDEVLTRAFNKYPSFQRCKIVRDKKTNKTKGYGFVSFKDPQDFIRAMRDMNGKYVGSRPIKLRKSTWKDRNLEMVKKKKKERSKLGLL